MPLNFVSAICTAIEQESVSQEVQLAESRLADLDWQRILERDP